MSQRHALVSMSTKITLLRPLLTLYSIVKGELTRLFRHHGALDVSRPAIFPLTTENDAEDGLVRVLGPDGTM